RPRLGLLVPDRPWTFAGSGLPQRDGAAAQRAANWTGNRRVQPALVPARIRATDARRGAGGDRGRSGDEPRQSLGGARRRAKLSDLRRSGSAAEGRNDDV